MVRQDAVQTIDADNYFYGEGWTKIDRGYEQASQLNMAGTEIGTITTVSRSHSFGRYFRPEDEGLLSAQDRVKMGMIGTLKD